MLGKERKAYNRHKKTADFDRGRFFLKQNAINRLTKNFQTLTRKANNRLTLEPFFIIKLKLSLRMLLRTFKPHNTHEV
jgi:hypothetical protein